MIGVRSARLMAALGTVGRSSWTRAVNIGPIGSIARTIGRDTVPQVCCVGTLGNSHMRPSDRLESTSPTNDLISLSACLPLASGRRSDPA